jgi:thymidine kinase
VLEELAGAAAIYISTEKTNITSVNIYIFKMPLEIVVGPMFSGKSTYALSYVRRQRSIGKKVLIIKPDIDNRYSANNLVTHDKEQIPCMIWDVTVPLPVTTNEMLQNDCIVIEEAQFFTGLKKFVLYMLQVYHKHILIVGLDGDARQKPFGEILDCIPWCSKLTKLHSLCSVCKDGTIAPFTKRINLQDKEQIVVGGSEVYSAVCMRHL